MSSAMETMQEAMTRLRGDGYDDDLDVRNAKIVRIGGEGAWTPEEVTVDETVRFEGPSDPDDMSVLYALGLPEGRRGLLVAPYGPEVTAEDAEVMRRLAGRQA
jgi:hypothetical protein